jgi:hypothetical protein
MTDTLETDWLISSGRGKPKYLSGIPHSQPRYVHPTLDVRARLVTLYPQLSISSAFIAEKRLTSLEKQIESIFSEGLTGDLPLFRWSGQRRTIPHLLLGKLLYLEV